MKRAVIASMLVLSVLPSADNRLWAQKAELLPIPDKLIVLSFDDANKSDRLFVAGILQEYGFGATFYVTEGLGFLKNKEHYTTWKEIRELHDMGFEIGNHTQHHRNITTLSPGQIRASLAQIEKRCAEHDIPKPTSSARNPWRASR